MGLDTTHGCWTGRYGLFNEFREVIAKAAGPELKKLYGHEADLEKYSRGNFLGIWEKAPADMIEMFLVHSDCDGYILSFHCEAMADRLEELKYKIPGDWKPELERFVKGLREAAEAGQNVQFQ